MKKQLRFGVVCILILLSPLTHFAQETTDCPITNSAFQVGEQITYSISYSWFFLWTDIGEVTFTVSSANKFGRDLLHLKSTGHTYPFYDSFFKVRDLYESWVDPKTIQPIYFNRAIYEGGFTKENEYQFDWLNNQALIRIRRKNGPNQFDTLKVDSCTLDIISAIYTARNLDYSNNQVNRIFPVTALFDKEIYHIGFKFLGREQKNIRGIEKLSCLKFIVDIVVGDIFSGDQKIYVWVTDDPNHLPIYIESPIKIGTIKAKVIQMKGLKYRIEDSLQQAEGNQPN